ncbi:MAG: hypothetical protein R3E08_02620 [Thiotrichaceae bacterium]
MNKNALGKTGFVPVQVVEAIALKNSLINQSIENKEKDIQTFFRNRTFSTY